MGVFQSLFGSLTGPQIGRVNAQELNELLQQEGELTLIDVRSPAEFAHDGHIEGAKLIPLQELMVNPELVSNEEEIIFVCRSGNRSMVACQQMMRLGITNIKNFDGGMISWQVAGLPVSH